MITSVSPTSPQWIEQLVNQAMIYERQPLTNLETQRDTLEIKDAVYNDIGSKIEAVQNSIENLIGSTYGITNAFNAKAISVVMPIPISTWPMFHSMGQVRCRGSMT